MFGKASKTKHLIAVSQLSTLLAEQVEITGDIVFASGVRIDGRVKGNVIGRCGEGSARSLLVLSDKGRIEGSVRCYDAVINGTVEGDLEVEHFLELQSKAHVTGKIRYQQLQMDVGAVVEGQLSRHEASAALLENVVDLPRVERVAKVAD